MISAAAHDTRCDLRGIVLAGGFGRRLREVTHALTGAPLPKQFCRFGSTRSLLQETLLRLQPLVPAERAAIVVDASFAALARAQTREWPGISVLVQPQERGTAPGVLLPLIHLLMEDPQALVVMTPSDHGIADADSFRARVATAAAAVESDPSRIVLLGVMPDMPSTDYGWIVPAGPPRSGAGAGVRPVAGFVEKPPLPIARRLLKRGALWNTMVVVARARALLDLYRRHRPDLATFFTAYAGIDPADRTGWLRDHYESLPHADFSRDLLAVARNLSVVACPVEMGWADLGSPERLFHWLARRGRPLSAGAAGDAVEPPGDRPAATK